LLALTLFRHDPAASEIVKFTLYPPEEMVFATPINATVGGPQFALSPNGRMVAFIASSPTGVPTLWLRRMSSVTASVLSGTENAETPFWSPDSRWVCFFANGKLMKIPADGGGAQMIVQGISDPRGGSWGADDVIIFSDSV